MNKLKRVIAIALVVIIVASLLATAALAASQRRVSGTGGTVIVETERWKVWRLWNKPTITVKNTGSRSAHIQIYDSDGHMVKNLTNLAAGKSHTFRNLDYNEKYTVGYSTHSMWGGKINLTISAKYGNIR